MKKHLSIVCIIIIFLASCTKQTSHQRDLEKPEIRVVYPSDNPMIPSGFPLCMQVMISDNTSLSKVWLQINDGTGFKKEYDIPGRMMSIIEKYTTSPSTSGQLIAKFLAMDEGGNLSAEEIRFTVNN